MIRLTDKQWEQIREHFPEEHVPHDRSGRKPISNCAVPETSQESDSMETYNDD